MDFVNKVETEEGKIRLVNMLYPITSFTYFIKKQHIHKNVMCCFECMSEKINFQLCASGLEYGFSRK
jgi:hypothetical protein